MRYLLESLMSLFYPNLCVVCSQPLANQENFICLSCRLNLPKTDYNPDSDNPARELLRGKIPLEKAYSHLYYNKGGVGQRIVAEIKYRKNLRLGIYMGQLIAAELNARQFFDPIDYLIPVPLHTRRLRTRGFNQAEAIAQGIASVSGVEQDSTSLIRKKHNPSQTTKGVYDRWLNAKGLFVLKDEDKFVDKHILLIDDVLTTGSTLQAGLEPFLHIRGIRISILTLAMA